MPKAFVLINVESGSEEEVLGEIKKTEGLPLLSEIPVIGALFSRKSTEKDKTELIVFITPRVMTGDVVSDEYINGNKPEEYIKAKTFK